MAYSQPRNTPNNAPDAPDTPRRGRRPSVVDLYDTFMSPLRGFFQPLIPKILGGKNMNYEQYMQQLNRKRNPNLNPNSNPNSNPNYRRVAADSWLKRTITGK